MYTNAEQQTSQCLAHTAKERPCGTQGRRVGDIRLGDAGIRHRQRPGSRLSPPLPLGDAPALGRFNCFSSLLHFPLQRRIHASPHPSGGGGSGGSKVVAGCPPSPRLFSPRKTGGSLDSSGRSSEGGDGGSPPARLWRGDGKWLSVPSASSRLAARRCWGLPEQPPSPAAASWPRVETRSARGLLGAMQRPPPLLPPVT